MSDAKVFAEIRNYHEMKAAFQRRAEHLGISRLKSDVEGGFSPGYSAKLLGPPEQRNSRNFGPITLGAMLALLRLKILLVEDA